MDTSRKHVFIITAIALAVAVSALFIFLYSIKFISTSVLDAGLDKNQKTDESYKAGLEGSKGKEQVQNPEDSGSGDEEEITGLTMGKPYSKKLVEDDSRNVLIVGEDKQYYLYDTIMILSISKKTNSVRIIQIPRDTYIDYNSSITGFLDSEGILHEPGIFKINYSHNIGIRMKYEGRFDPFTSINFLADIIEEKFAIHIDDFVKVNTQSFIEIVDLFGGVDIYVPYDMNYEDPTQNLSIHIEKGQQHLNGVQSEGFVRYRQGYDRDGNFHEYGDLERKKNQIAFMKAFIDQHGTIANIDKIPDLIKTLNLKHSIGFGDVLFTYMGMARDVIASSYEIESVILTGETKMINGSSYIVMNSEE
ncbi:MAG: LCP family protein [Acetivibrionales bacterium]